MPQSPVENPNFILSRRADFWLLGAASILIWVIMVIADSFRASSGAISQHFLQIAPAFGMLALICNHPHFMLSYKEGYGRGGKFIFKNWIALIFVPIALFALFASAYFSFFLDANESIVMTKVNLLFAQLGIGFRFGLLANYGTEVLSASVWLMYLTVGWHYSKQVFGCMMVYAHFDRVKFSAWDKKILKVNLFSIAIFNFFNITMNWQELNSSLTQQYFFSLPLTNIGLPVVLYTISKILLAVSCLGAAAMIFLRYRNKMPSINFFVPWLAFFIWWAPVIKQKEFYFMMVPFFHSMQYLPFAYRMIEKKSARKYALPLGLQVLLVLAMGYIAFEGLPEFLDTRFNTGIEKTTWFFAIAALVFINIHHFFIDSVIWRFDQSQVRSRLLSK